MIHVTRPFLPNIKDFFAKIESIWTSKHLTNDGPLHKELEKNLCSYLKIQDLCLVNNCTNGLLMCMNEFEPNSEIITTPFSFIATTSSIIWSKFIPVFCDINKDFLFIDINKIENLITKKTKAILATHVFGNTGNIEKLEKLCKRNNLKLIFDAAHSFGVKYKKKSILEYGDLSVVSFHATKLYHTIEGGAIYAKNHEIIKKLKIVKNFGYENHEIKELGINSKLSEFNCAMGLCNLVHIKQIIDYRKKICKLYDNELSVLFDNKKIKKPTLNKNIDWNYSYYPIIFNKESCLIKVMEIMKSHNIFPRRYFYPSLNTVKFLKSKKMKISEDISTKILCLPLYNDITKNSVKTISKILLNYFKN